MADQVIGQCQLERIIFNDGEAKIYVAHDLTTGQQVSVKLLQGAFYQDETVVKRFKVEAELMGRLNHPNVTRVLRHGYDQGSLFLVLEYQPGRLLRDFIREGRITTTYAFEITVQLCQALDYLHRRGVVHRDIRPENLFISEDGRVIVTNFSLVKVYRPDWQDSGLTVAGVILGAFEYISPEQRTASATVTAKTDVYSAGVCLYEMLTGKLPGFQFELPSLLNPEVDGRTDCLVAAMLSEDPGKRPASAAEVHARLLEIRSQPAAAPAPTPAAAPAPAPAPEAARSVPAAPAPAARPGLGGPDRIEELMRKAKERMAAQKARGRRPGEP